MSGIYPRAVRRLIPPGANDPAITPRIAVLHVAVTNADSLHDFFATKSGGIESHFYVRLDGTVEQYRDIYRQADAQLDANDFAVSIETAGMGDGEWTPAQLAGIKALLSWLHTEAGIALEECDAWNGHGVGYHTMWGAPSHWTPVAKTCPGPKRVRQFHDLLVPWMTEASKPTVPLLPVQHRIVTANLFEGNRDPLRGVNMIIDRAKAAFHLPPDVIACQETRRPATRAALAEVEGYQLLVADQDGEASLELAVLLRNGLHCLGVEYQHAAAPTGTGAFDHPRGIFVVRYVKRRRKVAVVNTHMGLIAESALVAGRAPGPAAQQHAVHAKAVAATMTRLRKAGFVVFVTADANANGSWSQSLPAVLAAAGMTVTQDRVDIVASDPKRVRKPGRLVIAAKLTGSDTHNAVAIRATEKRSKA
jgi:hypothetical protein